MIAGKSSIPSRPRGTAQLRAGLQNASEFASFNSRLPHRMSRASTSRSRPKRPRIRLASAIDVRGVPACGQPARLATGSSTRNPAVRLATRVRSRARSHLISGSSRRAAFHSSAWGMGGIGNGTSARIRGRPASESAMPKDTRVANRSVPVRTGATAAKCGTHPAIVRSRPAFAAATLTDS